MHSRTVTGIKVELPGRGVEEIALARLKPAYVDAQENRQLQQRRSLSPPPPPPSPPQQEASRAPARLPEPTARRTRQNPGPHRALRTAPRLDPEVFDDEVRARARAQSPFSDEASSSLLDNQEPMDNLSHESSPATRQSRSPGGSPPASPTPLQAPAPAPATSGTSASRPRPGAGGHGQGPWRPRFNVNLVHKTIMSHLEEVPGRR